MEEEIKARKLGEIVQGWRTIGLESRSFDATPRPLPIYHHCPIRLKSTLGHLEPDLASSLETCNVKPDFL